MKGNENGHKKAEKDTRKGWKEYKRQEEEEEKDRRRKARVQILKSRMKRSGNEEYVDMLFSRTF